MKNLVGSVETSRSAANDADVERTGGEASCYQTTCQKHTHFYALFKQQAAPFSKKIKQEPMRQQNTELKIFHTNPKADLEKKKKHKNIVSL